MQVADTRLAVTALQRQTVSDSTELVLALQMIVKAIEDLSARVDGVQATLQSHLLVPKAVAASDTPLRHESGLANTQRSLTAIAGTQLAAATCSKRLVL